MAYIGFEPKSFRHNLTQPNTLNHLSYHYSFAMTWQTNSLRGTSNPQLLLIKYLLFI